VIHLKIPRNEIQIVMGPGITELMATIGAQGIAATGAWFTHHLKMSSKVFDFEISVPVKSPVASTGRVKPSKWPAMKAVRTTYHGSYEGLGDAWGDFNAWIEKNELKPAADFWECYVAGPESGSDPAKWRTELTRKLIQ
jgi:effector-binding domain-containing protein